jgi:hypothetical protein
MRKLFLLFAGLIMTVSLFAQEVVEYGPDVFIDIDGIEIGGKPSREELAKHFGTPISDEYIEADLLNYYRITYDGVIINVEEDGTVRSFILESSEYPVMTLYGVGDGIRVGDSLNSSLLKGYPICYEYELDGFAEGEKRFCFYLKRKDFVPDHFTTFYVRDGTINKIISAPVEW